MHVVHFHTFLSSYVLKTVIQEDQIEVSGGECEHLIVNFPLSFL